MKTSPLASRFASLPNRIPAVLGAFVGSILLSAVCRGQPYEMQGPYASGGPPAGQSLYPQQGYNTSPYGQQYSQPAPPAAPRPQQPAYNQGGYNPSAYGQIQQPYPYPAGSAGTRPKTQPQGSNYPYQPKPPSQRPTANTPASGTVAQELAELKASQRRLEHRVDILESKTTAGDFGASPSTDKYFRHTVEYGDSLQGLANEYGVSVAQIKTANQLSSNLLTEGQVLKIPGKKGGKVPGNTPNFVSTSGNGTYIVQRGDTVGKIAATYGLSSTALINANKIRNPDILVVGQKLTLPGRAGRGNAGNGSTRKTTISSVSKRDTPAFVSKTTKSKPTVVYPDNTPPPGLGLTADATPAPTGTRGITSYRVEPGDSIESVARMFGTSASEIQRKNKLPSAKLPAIGEEIVVPQPGSVSS